MTDGEAAAARPAVESAATGSDARAAGTTEGSAGGDARDAVSQWSAAAAVLEEPAPRERVPQQDAPAVPTPADPPDAAVAVAADRPAGAETEHTVAEHAVAEHAVAEHPVAEHPVRPALHLLRVALTTVRYPLAVPSAAAATEATQRLVSQIDDYLFARTGRMDAPMLVVVGGPTGAGKSTLVNSLVRAPVTPAGVLRPTTRAPVLVSSPADAGWFTQRHLLPGMERSTGVSVRGTPEPGQLRLVSAPALPAGLALLDAPDINSVVDANRTLADQVLATADMWLFVTTAARYADAVPWAVLRTARERGTAVALVLDRVPAEAEEEVTAHFAELVAEHALDEAPVFVLPEVALDGQGMLAETLVAPLRDWLTGLVGDAGGEATGRLESAADRRVPVGGRDRVVRQTLDGALAAIDRVVERLAAAAADQIAAASALCEAVRDVYQDAGAAAAEAMGQGELMRGEALTRWRSVVGAAAPPRTLVARMERLRDRVSIALTGRGPGHAFIEAVCQAVAALVRDAVADASDRLRSDWRWLPGGAGLLDGEGSDRPGGTDDRAPADLARRAHDAAQDWHRALVNRVTAQIAGRRSARKVGRYTAHAAALQVAVAIFAPNPDAIGRPGIDPLRPAEVREVADWAVADLLARVHALLNADADRYLSLVEDAGVVADGPGRLRAAAAAVARAAARGDGQA